MGHTGKMGDSWKMGYTWRIGTTGKISRNLILWLKIKKCLTWKMDCI